MRGQFEEAEAAYRRASEHGHEPAPGLALLQLAEGRVEDASTIIRRAVDETDDAAARPAMLAAAVEIMRDAADLATARSAADELTDAAREAGSPLLRAV